MSNVFAKTIVAACLTVGAGSVAGGAVLIDQNFNSTPVGGYAFDPGAGLGGDLDRYEGNPQGSIGTVRVSGAVFAGASGRSVAYTDANASANAGPAIVGYLPLINSGKVELGWDFYVTVTDSQTFSHIGGGVNWGTAASQFVLSNGVIRIHHKDAGTGIGFTNIGTYTANTWYTVRYLFDVDAKQFDVFINGVELASDKPFEANFPANFSTGAKAFDIVSDLLPVDRQGATVLYIDNIFAQTVVPEPTALAALGLGVIPLLRRRRR